MTTTASGAEIGYRGPQVCKIVGITYRQLDYWARTGLVTPSITEAKGSGTQRRYSYGDLLGLKVIKSLLDAGLSLASARKAADCVAATTGKGLASAQLVIEGGSVVMATDTQQLMDVLRDGQGVLSLVPLSQCVAQIDAAVLEFHTKAPMGNSVTAAAAASF